MSPNRISFPVAVVALSLAFIRACIGLFKLDSHPEVIESGSGYKVFQTDDFSELTASAVNVYVISGKSDGLIRLEADPEIIDEIRVENHHGILSVNDKNNCAIKKGKDRARVIIKTDNLDNVIAVAGAAIIFDKPVTADTHLADGMITVDSAAVASAAIGLHK